MPAYDKADLQRRMDGAIEALKQIWRAAHRPSVDHTARSGHGRGLRRHMPLNQVATVSRARAADALGAGVGQVQRRAGRQGDPLGRLGLNPIVDGTTLRLPIPELTEERRKELAKLACQYAEKARIAVRNVRRDGMDGLKTDEKKGEISQDERKRHETEVQKLTDKTIADIDAAAAAKEKEILGK